MVRAVAVQERKEGVVQVVEVVVMQEGNEGVVVVMQEGKGVDSMGSRVKGYSLDRPAAVSGQW